MPSDIMVLEANLAGRDLFIGDIHGSLSALKKTIKEFGITSKDRLSLAGDLIDRGEDSAGVLDYLMQNPHIYAVRGNHEDMFIRYVFLKLNAESSVAAAEEFKRHKEIYFKNGGEWVEKLSDEQLLKYADYLQNLPYLMCILGDMGETKDDVERLPVLVGHAGIPISNSELINRIAEEKLELSAKEWEYITWARKENAEVLLSDEFRDSQSFLGIVGHTIYGGIRRDTNEVNLDVGTYDTQIVCVFDLHARRAQLICTGEFKEKNFVPANTVKNHINYYLLTDKKVPPEFLDDSLQKVTDIVVEYMQSPNEARVLFASTMLRDSEDIYLSTAYTPKEKSKLLMNLQASANNLIALIKVITMLEENGFKVKSLTDAIGRYADAYYYKDINIETVFLKLWNRVNTLHNKVKDASSLTTFSNSLATELGCILNDDALSKYAKQCEKEFPLSKPKH